MRDKQWAAFFFGLGLDQVREGFRAAIDGCDKRSDNARREYDAFLESHGTLEEDSSEHDRLVDISQSEWLSDNSRTVIREAFILSALHYWERRMRAWTNCDLRGFERLERHSRKMGYPTDPRLKVVNTLCNLLKHENSFHACELGKEWSDIFGELPRGTGDDVKWVLAINDRHVEEVFDIVSRSAPPHDESDQT